MTTAPEPDLLLPGTPIDVRTRYLSSWATGFEVLAVDGDQVRVRRRSDGTALPVPVPYGDVRASARAG